MLSAWASARPPFLVLTPAVVALGVSTAQWSSHVWSVCVSAWLLALALAAHISVNAFNEAADFANGLDARTQRTPFSGGSGLLQAHAERLPAVRALAWGSLAFVVFSGLLVVVWRGWPLLLLGSLGLTILLAYSGHLVRSPWGSLLAPGLAFGPVMVLGTHLALGAPLTPAAVLASLLPFFSVNNLLLLNQLPDLVADREVGRRNWPIAYGLRATRLAYAVFVVGMILVAIVALWGAWWPPSAALVALVLWPLVLVWRGLRGLEEGDVPTNATLAANVVVAVGAPATLAVGLFLG